MSPRISCLLALVVATASAACSTTPTRVSAPARSLVSCAGGSVESPEQAAAFAGCEILTGDLAIRGSGIGDLGLLSELREVSGSLVIADNDKLVSLAGLESLSSVGGLEIRNNPKLESLAGLEALTLARTVTVSKNPALDSLDGLEGLTKLDRLELRDNGFASTAGLEGLERVGELVVAQNRALISLRGLRNVTSAGSVEISENPRLCAQLGLLPRLEVVERELSVTKNWGLSQRDVEQLRARTERDAKFLGVGDRVAL